METTDFIEFHPTLAKRTYTYTTYTRLARKPATMRVRAGVGASQTTYTK
jgi:hypothetical protein